MSQDPDRRRYLYGLPMVSPKWSSDRVAVCCIMPDYNVVQIGNAGGGVCSSIGHEVGVGGIFGTFDLFWGVPDKAAAARGFVMADFSDAREDRRRVKRKTCDLGLSFALGRTTTARGLENCERTECY